MALNIMTLNIMTFNILTLYIMALSITLINCNTQLDGNFYHFGFLKSDKNI